MIILLWYMKHEGDDNNNYSGHLPKNLFELESLPSGMRSIAQVSSSDDLYVPGGIETASDGIECGL